MCTWSSQVLLAPRERERESVCVCVCHHGSNRKTCDAHCRFRPSPPARRESSIISTSGLVLKAWRTEVRIVIGMEPTSLTCLKPAFFNRHSTYGATSRGTSTSTSTSSTTPAVAGGQHQLSSRASCHDERWYRERWYKQRRPVHNRRIDTHHVKKVGVL